jgi:hypothetical protein
MTLRPPIVAACCALLVLSAGAQTQTPVGPVLRATTRVVEVNVVVHDRKGAPVADLMREEFEIYDEGVKQQVATLRMERTEPAADAPRPAPGSTRVLLGIEPRHLTLRQEGVNRTGLVDVLFFMQGAPEEPATATAETMNLSLSPQRYEAASKEGLLMAKDIESARIKYRLKIAVRDAATGSVGSVSIRR